jgi:methionine-S-sulfoxide reductase
MLNLKNIFYHQNQSTASQKLAELRQDESLQLATLAGGCFWCMEAPYQDVTGVADVIAGYAGGSESGVNDDGQASSADPAREAAQVFFDPNQISYQKILDIFWLQIDPTDPGGQFADRGPEYTTAIYYHDQDQQRLIEESIRALDKTGKYDKAIVTKVLPYSSFSPASEDHQDFYQRSAQRYQQYKVASGRGPYIEEQLLSDKKTI